MLRYDQNGISMVSRAGPQIPVGVFSRPAFMITKESRSIAIKGLRQEQSLRDHGDAVEVGYVLNLKFPDLIPPGLLKEERDMAAESWPVAISCRGKAALPAAAMVTGARVAPARFVPVCLRLVLFSWYG
jgi:hypothetical protein